MHRFARPMAVILLVVTLLCSTAPVAAAPTGAGGEVTTFVGQLAEWLWSWTWGSMEAVQGQVGPETNEPEPPRELESPDTAFTSPPPDDTTETHPLGDPDG